MVSTDYRGREVGSDIRRVLEEATADRRQVAAPGGEGVLLTGRRHSFNLDYPVVPYIGNIREARVVILGANAGYSRDETPLEFAGVDDARASWSSLRQDRQLSGPPRSCTTVA